MVDEENLDDSDDLEKADEDQQDNGGLLSKDQIFPALNHIDSQTNAFHSKTHMHHNPMAEELEQEEAIFNEMVKKRY